MPTSTRLLIAAIVTILVAMLMFVLIGYTPLGRILGITSDELDGRDKAQGSLQMAVNACQNNVRSSLGSSLLQSKVDNISTRYNMNKQTYTVFINLVIEGKERLPTYFQCEVSAVSQRIIRTRIEGAGSKFSLI